MVPSGSGRILELFTSNSTDQRSPFPHSGAEAAESGGDRLSQFGAVWEP